MNNYPIQLDEIDQWLFDSFGIVAGACSSTENLRYNTAKMVAEALLKRDQVEGPSRNQVDKLEEAAADADIHLTYDEYMKCLDAAIEEYERRDKDVYCHETSFRWGFEAGANWQKEQLRDLCYQCEKNYDNVFFKGEQNAIKRMEKENKETIEIAEEHAMLAGMVKQEEEMKKDAIETTIVNDWTYGKDPDNAIIPAIHQRIEGAKVGDKVKVYFFKDNKE